MGGPATSTGLTATGRVVLGMLALGKRTGYEIKQFVDKTTRHFWAASYGQIYPELRRLESAGLLRGRAEPSGARARTVFELTREGSETLARWLRAGGEPLFELRDEGMLKLFFSDLAGPGQHLEIIRAIRERHERTLGQLRSIADDAKQPRPGPYLTLGLGIAIQEAIVEWCRTTELELGSETREQ